MTVMIKVTHIRDFHKGDVVNIGAELHLRITKISQVFPDGCELEAEDITPLPGCEPDGYACHLCGIIEPAKEDGSLPDGWVEKKFPTRSFFVCKECNEGVHDPYCRVCGCTQDDACWDEEEGSCYWVEEDLCSACKGKETKVG